MTDLRVPAERDIAGVERGAPFDFFFEGKPVRAYPGESVGAALMAAGITTFRTTRVNGWPRGIFCGIGICFDCLVVVNGRPNVRACVTPAAAGMRVRAQRGTAEDVYDSRE